MAMGLHSMVEQEYFKKKTSESYLITLKLCKSDIKKPKLVSWRILCSSVICGKKNSCCVPCWIPESDDEPTLSALSWK